MTRRRLLIFALVLGAVFLFAVPKIDHTQGEGFSLLMKAVDYRKAGELDEAKRTFLQAIPVLEAENDQKSLGIAYGNLALIAEKRGDLEEAYQFYRGLLGSAEALGDKKSTVIVYNKLGDIAYTRNEYKEASRMFLKSLELYEALGNKEGIADSSTYLGEIAAFQNNLEEAENFYYRSLKLQEKLKDKEGIARIYVGLSLVSLKRKNTPAACEQLRKAEPLYAEVGADTELQKTKRALAKAECK